MKIQMEHIPRTIFGVKYNMKLSDGSWIYNKYDIISTKNLQIKMFELLKATTELYSDVKMIRWHLNSNDDYPHDERCEGTMCYCSNRAKKEGCEKWNKYISQSNSYSGCTGVEDGSESHDTLLTLDSTTKSQSNHNGEILSDTRNTTVENKSLNSDGSFQPMPNRPDVDKALGFDKLSNPDDTEVSLKQDISKSGRDTLNCPICYKPFKTTSERQSHYLEKHS